MKIRALLLAALVAVLAACGGQEQEPPQDSSASPTFGGIPTLAASAPTITPYPMPLPLDDPRFPIEPSEAGKELYQTHCSECHGPDGEGQAPDPSGLLVAPPHNETGHTWHHPDQANYAIVHNGRQAEGVLTPMPGFSEMLTEEEMFSILAYIKTLWQEDQVEQQRNVTVSVAG